MKTFLHPVAASILVVIAIPAMADDAFGPNPTWQSPDPDEVRVELFTWLDQRSATDAQRAAIEEIWPADAETIRPEPPLDRLARSIAVVESNAKNLVDHCSEGKRHAVQPDFGWLLDEETPAFVRNNMRLFYARWLAQEQMYDEALLYMTGLEPQDVVDPMSLLFYRAVAYQQIVQADESREAALTLLERADELPRRYREVAELLREDVAELQADSLDHIARRMGDIRRRLDLGRAGKKVRDIEDGVIASLDKLIKQMEDQQQQSSASSSSAPSPSQPMQDSRIGGLKGPGKVDKKDVGSRSGWGDLPPKAREEALQQIGKEFPAHFRDAIEQYFRRLASEEKPEQE